MHLLTCFSKKSYVLQVNMCYNILLKLYIGILPFVGARASLNSFERYFYQYKCKSLFRGKSINSRRGLKLKYFELICANETSRSL